MSLVTTCPACGTRFRFNPVDVSAHGGEGRCSVCRHVFNALNYVSQLDDAPVEPLPQQNEEMLFSAEEPAPVAHDEPVQAEAVVENAIHAETLPEPIISSEPLPETLFVRKPSRLPQFLKQLTAVSLLLALALVQIALFYRQQVITYLPSSYALFASLCKPLACTAPLPHQSALIAIEDYRLISHPDFKDVLILKSTLSNHARFPQAYPLLELTLTDQIDTPVALRRLTPEEYLSGSSELASGIPAGGSATVQVYLSAGGVESSKYKLVAKDAPVLSEQAVNPGTS